METLELAHGNLAALVERADAAHQVGDLLIVKVVAIEALEKEIQQLEEIAGKTWKKEEELKGLKAELAALDRKIQLELVPPVPEKDISDKSQTENNTIKSGEFHPDTIVQHERKVRIGL